MQSTSHVLFTCMLVTNICLMVLACDCPQNCACSCNKQGLPIAACQLEQVQDYSALGDLSASVVELDCHIIGPFMENEFYYILHLVDLKRMVLHANNASKHGSHFNNPSTLGFKNPDIFHDLRGIKHLGIHLPLTDLNIRIIRSLENLQVLDLSNTERLSTSVIETMLHGINTAKLPLITLNLTRVHVQGVLTGMTLEPINVRTHIYQHVKDIDTLRTLDIRDNGVVQLQAGLTEYLPRLEELFVGGNVFTYFHRGRVSYLCSVLDVLIHPNLRKLEYSFFPGAKSRLRRSHSPGSDIIDELRAILRNCSSFANESFDVLHCICQGEMNTSSCNVNDNSRLLSMLAPNPETRCIGGLQILLPVNLEELSIRTALTPRQNTEAGGLGKAHYCFSHNNKLSRLDMSSSYLDNTVRYSEINTIGLHHLTSVNLEFNNLDLLKIAHWFSGAPIRILYLSGNILQGTECEISQFLANFPQLEILRLSQCRMSVAPPVDCLTNLVELDVSHNDLTTFAVNLSSLNKLEKLDLSNNGISYLPEDVTDALEKRAQKGEVIVDLSGNPLLCQCNTMVFVTWLRDTHHKRVIFANNHSMLCRCISGALRSPWEFEFEWQIRNCGNFYPIIYTTLSCTVAIVIIVLVVFLYKKRWSIRFWVHVARESWRRRQDQRISQGSSFRYDVFVAYSSRDTLERKWVHLTLVPKLETEYGLKVCIHHRDFLPGVDILDNIVDAINGSRKILLVLSPNFVDSDWCNFEVRMAKVKLIEEKRDNIVLVLYKQLDIPGARFSKELTRLLEKKTYAVWTSKPEGQKLFWRKLVAVLRCEVLHPDPFAGIDTVPT